MNQKIFLDDKRIEVIAYFMFKSTGDHYIIYCKPKNKTELYLGNVIEEEGIFKVYQVEKTYSFLLKKFIQELINKDLTTIKGYSYLNKLEEIPSNLEYYGSQTIVINTDQKKIIKEFIKEINENNEALLEKAKEEYYIQLVEEREKDRRTIIILLSVLIFIIAAIAYMIIDFMRIL